MAQGIRLIDIEQLNSYVQELGRIQGEYEQQFQQFANALNNLYSAGIIEGARVRELENSFGIVNNTKRQVQEKIQQYVDFIQRDVVSEGQDLETSQASELSSLLDSLGLNRS